jgi:predicted SnoaL-like aldol condensation-catalyzing enzyme
MLDQDIIILPGHQEICWRGFYIEYNPTVANGKEAFIDYFERIGKRV